MENMDYDKLAEALVSNKNFMRRISGMIGQQSVSGFKGRLEVVVNEMFEKQKDSIKSEFNTWVNGHLLPKIEERKSSMLPKFERYLESDGLGEMYNIFKEKIDDLIREKFADVKVSFTIGDLFGKVSPDGDDE